jgi:hypothetical protein
MYKNCFVRQWLRYGMGLTDDGYDAKVVPILSKAMEENQNDLKQLLLGLVQSDPFRFRKIEGSSS